MEAGLAEKVVEEIQYNFEFPMSEAVAGPAIVFQKVGFAYSGEEKDKLYDNLELGVDMESRVALVGPNGAGKSTLLKLMLDEIKPTNGEIRKHLHLSIGRYNQHSNDQLDATMCPLDFIQEQFKDRKPKMEEQEWRSYLGRFGVSGPMQKQPIGCLSDGQKSRVVFAMMAVTRPNLLLLDEPTKSASRTRRRRMATWWTQAGKGDAVCNARRSRLQFCSPHSSSVLSPSPLMPADSHLDMELAPHYMPSLARVLSSCRFAWR